VDTQHTNLLVNGGFEFNQHGVTVTTNNTFIHDRWKLLLNGTSTATVTDETGTVDAGSAHAMKVVYTQGTPNSQIDQPLENVAGLKGATVSVSARIRQTVASGVRLYINDNISGKQFAGSTAQFNSTTVAFVTLTVTAPVSATAGSVSVGYDLSTTGTYYLDNTMLVIGSVPTTYVPETPALGFARCQRYYQIWSGAENPNLLIANGQCYSTTQAVFILNHPPFGGQPTWTASATGGFAITDATLTGKATTGITPTNPTTRSVRFDVTIGSASLVAGNASTLLTNNTSSARLRGEWNP
jgi:hypothetical protein